jgi:hypothetical protein
VHQITHLQAAVQARMIFRDDRHQRDIIRLQQRQRLQHRIINVEVINQFRLLEQNFVQRRLPPLLNCYLPQYRVQHRQIISLHHLTVFRVVEHAASFNALF